MLFECKVLKAVFY